MHNDVMRIYFWLLNRRHDTVEEEIAKSWVSHHKTRYVWYSKMSDYIEAAKNHKAKRGRL